MLILSAGPTTMAENTLEAMKMQKWNSDLSKDFYEQYQRVVAKYDEVIKNTTGYTFVMGAEAMITLEGACASLIEKGDSVLVFANGIFGRGFVDLVQIYGGEPILVSQPDDRGFPLKVVEKAVSEHPQAKIAILIHCETPTGVTNNINPICQFLNQKGVLSIVDSVSAVGGEDLNYDESKVDVLLGGSQKCISAPSGLGMVTLSREAIQRIQYRKTPIASFYANFQYFLNWREKMWFPYTMPEQTVNALEVALDNLLAKDFIGIHKQFAEITRYVLTENAIELFAKENTSNTVTAFYAPEGVSAFVIMEHLQKKYNIIISGSLGEYQPKVLRIGHMGENNRFENFESLFLAMDRTWDELEIGESHFLDSFYEITARK